jgi:hypothetical protein
MQHIQYGVRHFKPSSPCIDEDLVINTNLSNPDYYPYELWSGNRIAIVLPPHWNSRDHIMIENRVFDDNYPTGGPFRFDKGLSILFYHSIVFSGVSFLQQAMLGLRSPTVISCVYQFLIRFDTRPSLANKSVKSNKDCFHKTTLLLKSE